MGYDFHGKFLTTIGFYIWLWQVDRLNLISWINNSIQFLKKYQIYNRYENGNKNWIPVRHINENGESHARSHPVFMPILGWTLEPNTWLLNMEIWAKPIQPNKHLSKIKDNSICTFFLLGMLSISFFLIFLFKN